MRIHKIVSGLGVGGAEAFAVDLALALQARGHRLQITALSHAREMGDDSEVEARNRTRLAEAGVAVEIIGHRKRRRVWPAARQLRRNLRGSENPDLIHCHLKLGIALTLLAGWRGTVVATHHNTPLPRPAWPLRLLSHRTGAYVAISSEAKRNLTAVAACPVHHIPNGIDLERLGDISRKPAEEGTLRVVSLGNLRPQKNYTHLVEIAAGTQPGIHFSIAGEGAERATIEARIAELGLQDRVRLLGARADVSALLQNADAYLLTSKWEGMPIALIEAMQAGLPIISSDVGGCREILGEETGFLCPSDDTEAFTTALNRLAGDTHLRARMGRAARARAKDFGIDPCAEAHEALYAEVLG
ncbi:MAG: glycosyltransferase [Pseudomonadota bacterium]